MKEPPSVSVVVPTYQRPEFLRRAVASVMGQSLTSWELIIVDDNGADHEDRFETEAIVATYADDPRIRYVRHDRNRGGGAARNTGVEASTAPYVAFLDDDDEWHPDKLALQLECFEGGPSDVAMAYCRVRVVRAETGEVTTRPTDGRSHAVRDLLRRNSIGTTSCIMCRRSAFLDVGSFDEALPARQDQDLYVRLAQRFAFAFVDEVLVTLHVHGRPRISTDANAALRAHDVFFAKHRSLIEADPEALRAMYLEQGRHLIDAGRHAEARRVLTKVWRSRPFDMAVLAQVVKTYPRLRAFIVPTKRFVTRLRGRHR